VLVVPVVPAVVGAAVVPAVVAVVELDDPLPIVAFASM
jgi:hypothetical protein